MESDIMSSTSYDDSDQVFSDSDSSLNSFNPLTEQPSNVLASHLVPCSRRKFLQLDLLPNLGHNLVDGYLISYPNMANTNHVKECKYTGNLLEMANPDEIIYSSAKVEVVDLNHALNNQPTAPSGQSSSSPPSRPATPASISPPRIPGTRDPDLVIAHIEDNNHRSILSPASRKITFRVHNPPLAVIEVTSKSTRSEDIYLKWTAYARSNIPLYIIFDRPSAHDHTAVPTVIVGSKVFLPGSVRMPNGDANFDREKRGSAPATSTSEPVQPSDQYYRKVYRSYQIVDCDYLKPLHMTAAKWLSVENLRDVFNRMRKEGYRDRQMIEEERGKRKKAEDEREEEKHKREEAEDEREEEKRKREEAEVQIRELKSRLISVISQQKRREKGMTDRSGTSSDVGDIEASAKRPRKRC